MPQITALLRESAMLVAPCIISEGGDRDGLPTILVEAMALGTPCVSTRVVGIPELVRDQITGLCVPPKDAAALADAITTLLANPARARQMADAARALVEREYDVHHNTGQLRALFAQSVQTVADHPLSSPERS